MFGKKKNKSIEVNKLSSLIADNVEIVGDDGQARRITVVRAHLEEDAGKSVHDAVQGMTGVDLIRAGTPLLEIV